MENEEKIIDWLMQGDPAIRYQTMRDLTGANENELAKEREQIALTGWGKQLLDCQDAKGTWANGLYSPKWKSTTYSLLLLRRLGIETTPGIEKGCYILLNKGFYKDDGINLFPSWKISETCVTGMVLSILSFFRIRDERLELVAGHLLGQQMEDGGWNCESYKGHTHSSFHTTISVLEGLREYEKYVTETHTAPLPGKLTAQLEQIKKSRDAAVEFLLEHKLFQSHRTGEVVDERMLRFSFPPRWYYDIMRGLDFMQDCRVKKDKRFEDAIAVLKKKQTKEGAWKLQNRHTGKTFFELEKPGKPSRMNTLRAMRILRWWDEEQNLEQSTGYIKDPKTGEWKVVNPAGSAGYNYLYRDY